MTPISITKTQQKQNEDRRFVRREQLFKEEEVEEVEEIDDGFTWK